MVRFELSVERFCGRVQKASFSFHRWLPGCHSDSLVGILINLPSQQEGSKQCLHHNYQEQQLIELYDGSDHIFLLGSGLTLVGPGLLEPP